MLIILVHASNLSSLYLIGLKLLGAHGYLHLQRIPLGRNVGRRKLAWAETYSDFNFKRFVEFEK